MIDQSLLVSKYNQPVPRYTSYPTVPNWHLFENKEDWMYHFWETFQQQEEISLYIHLPFCESLCTYCGCNKKITTNHAVEGEYIDALLKEWDIYTDLMPRKPVIRELHLGGGTPTFFSPQQLDFLLKKIFRKAVIPSHPAFSIEGHPNNTTPEHLAVLAKAGFTRISYGVQDNDPVVQVAINRIQPLENVRTATLNARVAGFTSVNYDLVYGLPFQTVEGLRTTLEQTIELQPDRIAFYSYAHVPWKSKAQRLFDEKDLPSPELKNELYALGREMLLEAGYHDIGMDHFAREHDELYIAQQKGTLHRNFMGYTVQSAPFLLGLGVSAISDTGRGYAQNHKELENYYRSLLNGEPAVAKGFFLSATDLDFKQYILDIACRGKIVLQPRHQKLLEDYTLPKLDQLEADGLLIRMGNEIIVSNLGKQFIRIICEAFDLYRHNTANSSKLVFSKAV